jgi:hypothetical protein
MVEADPRAARVRRRWVRRYLVSETRAILMPRPVQRWYQWRLRRAARRAPAADLALLLTLGWHEARAAIWLIAAGRRVDLRPVIERGILSESPSCFGWSYCPALACLGTEEDARILVTYLDQALRPQDESHGGHSQPEALATLMYLDEQLGTNHAQQFFAADGLWHRWPGSADVSLTQWLDAVRVDVAFATGADPGVRRMLKQART